MILLDTNVVSETMRRTPAQSVVDWLNAQAADTLYMSSISLAELLSGIAILPEGRRKTDLSLALADGVKTLFGSRLLAFDLPAARAYAAIASRTRAGGRPISFADGLIAAVAAAHEFTVATRDTGPFEAAGVNVIDPWS